MKRKQTISLLLLAAMLATTACGGSNDTPGNDTTPQDGSDTTPIEEGYDFQGKDFNDYEFKVLNLDEQFGCYIRLDFDEQTGEKLDDAVYDRNRKIEEKLNFQFKEIVLPGGAVWQTGQVAVCDALIQDVMSDDDAYDAAYVPPFFKPEVVTGGYLLNLLDIPEMHLYEKYWDVSVNEEMTVNDTLYTASGPLNFMSLDLCWLLLFNEDMMTDLKMEYPYQLVRDGKWTLDKLNEYVSAGANLNGDESFQYNVDGNSVYGIAGHTSAPLAFMFSAGTRFYERSNTGEIELTLGSDRLYSAMEKIAHACTLSDGKMIYSNQDLPSIEGYTGIFSVDRALFLTCQLKAAMELRVMESTFGMVPMPKLDETQENYSSLIASRYEFLVIPKTQDDPSRAGFILDALTYESYQSVLPVYYDVTVSQKGLRNDDSIEMLEIIRDNSSIDFMYIYKISETATNALSKLVQAGTGDVSGAASAVASNEPTTTQKLLEFLDALESNKQ